MDTAQLTKVKDLMGDFAANTGLNPDFSPPVRYLWTDAFAVCNYLGLYSITHDTKYLELGLKLIDQVHHVLGKNRGNVNGWISGLDDKTGEIHPTLGGLRIGKELDERGLDQQYDEVLEWERDGQYYHYITKWIHALNKTAETSKDIKYVKWAGELLKTAHDAFSYKPAPNLPMRLYWKMSIDLKRPLVSSMGQQDPLDGYLTYKETEAISSQFNGQKFEGEIKEIGTICKMMDHKTSDPLGIGGLLADASRTTELMINGNLNRPELLDKILQSAFTGIRSYIGTGQLSLSPNYRLAFRELGLSIGLKGIKLMEVWMGDHPGIFTSTHKNMLRQIKNFEYISQSIDEFWLNPLNQKSMNWKEHRDINMVMLATSLCPQGFLSI